MPARPDAPGEILLFLLVLILVEALFLHLAAKFLTRNPRYSQAILVALLGGLISGLVLVFLDGTLGLVLAALVWLFVCGNIYGVGLVRALLIGVLAAVLFVLTQYLISLVLERIAEGGPASLSLPAPGLSDAGP